MIQAPYNAQIRAQNLPYLRYLIQTDNYKYKGTFNYNRLMKFLTQTEYNLGYECK